jgi:hypothetical protein
LDRVFEEYQDQNGTVRRRGARQDGRHAAEYIGQHAKCKIDVPAGHSPQAGAKPTRLPAHVRQPPLALSKRTTSHVAGNVVCNGLAPKGKKARPGRKSIIMMKISYVMITAAYS